MSDYILTFYDLDYNILAQFDSYKEAAEYFNTSECVIRCYISRKKKNKDKVKRFGKVSGYLIKDKV